MQNLDLLKQIFTYADAIMFMTDYWAKTYYSLFTDIIKTKPIFVFPHGIEQLNIKDKLESRKALKLPENGKLILNLNRNQPRKNIDHTIEAFIALFSIPVDKFDAEKENVYLILFDNQNGSKTYNYSNVFSFAMSKYFSEDKRQMMASKIISRIIINNEGENLPDSVIELYHNACDFGINTCNGEGFGLCAMEGMGYGKPQIISNVGGHKHWQNPKCCFIINPTVDIHSNSGILRMCTPTDIVNQIVSALRLSSEDYNKMSKECINYYNSLDKWNVVVSRFKLFIKQLK